MICKNCGNKIQKGDKFCPSCGHPVPVEEAPTDAPATPSATEKLNAYTDKLKKAVDSAVDYTKGPLADKVKATTKEMQDSMKPKMEELSQKSKECMQNLKEKAGPASKEYTEKSKALLHEFKDELTNNTPDPSGNPQPDQGKWNPKKILLAVVSLLIPLIGLVAFFVCRKKNNPILDKLALCCAIVGFVGNFVINGFGSSDDFDSSDYTDAIEDSGSNYGGSSNSNTNSYESQRIVSLAQDIDKDMKELDAIENQWQVGPNEIFRAGLLKRNILDNLGQLATLLDRNGQPGMAEEAREKQRRYSQLFESLKY